MNVRLQRTVLNWRWWAVFPILVVFALLCLCCAVAEELEDWISIATRRLDDWARGA